MKRTLSFIKLEGLRIIIKAASLSLFWKKSIFISLWCNEWRNRKILKIKNTFSIQWLKKIFFKSKMKIFSLNARLLWQDWIQDILLNTPNNEVKNKTQCYKSGMSNSNHCAGRTMSSKSQKFVSGPQLKYLQNIFWF